MDDRRHIRRFYIDESGNTGDAIRTGVAFDFDRQPVFVLACLGVEDDVAFAETFAALKTRHRLQGAEVKSDAAWRKPAFFLELIAEIERLDLPVFLEVVDKRFYIAAQLVNAMILRPVDPVFDHSPPSQFMRNAIAEYVTEVLPAICLTAFVDACAAADGQAVLRAYAVLLEALEAAELTPFRNLVVRLTSDGRDELVEEGPDDPVVVRRCLPLPDANPAGKPVWMLPHLSSLTHLYARLNTYAGGRLDGVSIVHDQQLQYADILQANKAAAEGLADQSLPIAYGPADFIFREQASLTFSASDRSAGIQAADVLAGYAMRLIVNRLTPGSKPRHDGDWQLRRLLDQDESDQGRGTNFVMTTATLRAAGVSDQPDPFSVRGRFGGG